jgi:hypothetical protein
MINLHPPDPNLSHQLTALPPLTPQRLLAHPRRIEPTRLEFPRRASILIVEPNHRLMGLIAFPVTGKSLDRVWTPRAAGRVVATTDSGRLPIPRDQRQRA